MKYYIIITRPLNCLFIAFAVMTGGMLNNSIEDYAGMIAAVIAAVLIAAGGYVINDFYDLPVDVVNKPRRILPRGKIDPEKAYIYAMFLFVCGFSVSFFTAVPWAIFIAIVNSLLLYFYAKYFKRIVFFSNLIISYIVASSFLFGAIVGENIKNILPILFFTFLYTFVREMIKDAEDRTGDAKVGVRTLATSYGEKKSVLLSLIPSLLLALSLFFSYQKQLISNTFFITITLAYLIPLIIIYIRLFADLTTSKLHESSVLIKLHMLSLLIIMIIIY